VSTNDGAIRHVQSGFVCPLTLTNADLIHLDAYPSKRGLGTDVSCDYAAGTGGDIETKLTVFVVKIDPKEPLESVFGRYRSEVLQTYPNAEFLGTGLRTKNQKGQIQTLDAPDLVRSVEYRIEWEGQPCVTGLAVSKSEEWALEIRLTYPFELKDMEGGTLGSAWATASTNLLVAQGRLPDKPKP